MCGLIGVAGCIHKDELSAFHDGLVFSSVRGPHSTGVGVVRRKEVEVEIVKRVGSPYELFDSKEYSNVIDKANKSVLLGHNRWATLGKVSKANAHPFDFESLTGTHNGTIDYLARRTLERHEDFETDSEALFFNIDKYSPEEVIPQLDGAWALVWYDKYFDTLNMIRNEERTLYYTFSEDKASLFWCSEHALLLAALYRNGIKHGDIHLLPQDHLFIWDLPATALDKFDGKPVERKKVKGKPKFFSRIEAKKKEPEKTTIQTPSPTKVEVKSGVHLKTFGKTTSHLGTNTANSNVVDLVTAYYKGYKGEKLSKTNFEEKVKNGCCWCSSPIEWGEVVRFINPDDALCHNCITDKTTLANISEYADAYTFNSTLENED